MKKNNYGKIFSIRLSDEEIKELEDALKRENCKNLKEFILKKI